MSNIQLQVNWLDERANENDDNNGYHHGIYIFDCDVKDYDPEAGYGSYDILDALWFNDECERDFQFYINLFEFRDSFTTKEVEEIFKSIENEEILTEDIADHFKQWVSNHIEDSEIIENYMEFYSNGLTHKENLKIILG